MSLITKENLQQQMRYFQEIGLIDTYNNVTIHGAVAYRAKKYIEEGNLKPPIDGDMAKVNEFNRVLRILIKYGLATDNARHPVLINTFNDYVELIDRSQLDGRKIISVDV
jgi:hypothetical protein